MGVFNKINEKGGKIVAGVILVALALFIFGELFGPTSLFFNKRNVGEINGKTISIEEYSKLLEAAGPDGAWAQLINKYAFNEQYEKLGLSVSEEEIDAMLTEKNLWSEFKNPQMFPPDRFPFNEGYQFNFKKFEQWKKQAEQDEAFTQNLRNFLKERRMAEKYQKLIQNSVYVTKEEAQREYKASNAKAEVKYLYVSYNSIPDSSIKLTDDEINEYIKNHEKEFKKEKRASIEYVAFEVKPSAKDSSEPLKELKELKQEFATAENDSAFVAMSTDNPAAPRFMSAAQLPQQIKDSTLEQGKVYGPFFEGTTVRLYKVGKVDPNAPDSLSAKHILFSTQGKDQKAKDSVKAKAQGVLEQLKNGANFEELAKQYSEDPGSKDKGGLYDWFPMGQMVKPFEDAIVKAPVKSLVPELVETQFGYHIIYANGKKTTLKYEVSSIERMITAEDGRTKAHNKAYNFFHGSKDSAAFRELAKKEKLKIHRFENLTDKTNSISPIPDPADRTSAQSQSGMLQNPRELVRWALIDGDPGDVSEVFTIGDKYVIAVLTRQKDKGLADAYDLRKDPANTYSLSKIYSEKKAKIIADSLSNDKFKGMDIDKRAQAYGPTAQKGTANDVTLANSTAGLQYDPIVTGAVFGLKPGKQTFPIKGESGVAILQLIKVSDAPAIADYNTYKKSLTTTRQQSVKDYQDAEKAITEDAEIEDNRIKFY